MPIKFYVAFSSSTPIGECHASENLYTLAECASYSKFYETLPAREVELAPRAQNKANND